MCRDGSSAARYLNGQLTNLWENAIECIEECEPTSDWQSEEYEQSAYMRALAQFHYWGKKSARAIHSTDDLLFCARFSKPELKFICNHEAALILTLQSGHLNLDYGKATAVDYQLDSSQTTYVENLQVAFRFEFSKSELKGRDANNKSSKQLIQLIVLDLSAAKMVMLRPDTELNAATKAALSFYMHKYLEFLRTAGYHTLYDLPDFENKFKAKVDYSLHQRPAELDVLCAGVSVHGTSIQEVNTFLHRQWLNAASSGNPENPLSACIAELNSSWLTGASVETPFHIRFGPPKVAALCQNEIIFYFDIDGIALFTKSSGASKATPDVYHQWKIAFVMDVIQETEDGKAQLRLDFQTARFSSYLSERLEMNSTTYTYFRQIVRFISVEYMQLLVHHRLDIVYSVDVDFTSVHGDRDSIASLASDSSGWSVNNPNSPNEPRANSDLLSWAERDGDMVGLGFDEVLTISEQSVNAVFDLRWKKASEGQAHGLLARWVSELFQGSFGVIKARLLSNGKAIVWISVDEGTTTIARETVHSDFWTWIGFKTPTKGQTMDRYRFEDLSLAFEVDLEFAKETDLTLNDVWKKAFESTAVFTHGSAEHRVFRHLLLDVRNAKYIASLSNIHNLGEGRIAVTRLQSIIHYIKEYLLVLAAAGTLIIHSVPTYSKGSSATTGLTDVAFQVVSHEEITTRNCLLKRRTANAPAILVLGVHNFRALPSMQLDWSSGWVFRSKGAKTMGMACLSREAFLESRLLRVLSKINAVTTIVPRFADVIDGEWHCDLTTWSEHEYRRGKECRWKRIAAPEAGYIEYEWQHRDDWNHEHEDTYGEEKSGEYRLSCHTRNILRIPAAFRPNGLELELRGESTIKVSGKTDHVWSMRSSASWSVTVFVYSEASGLFVETSGEAKPIFSDVEAEGTSLLDVRELHAKYLPKSVSADGMLMDLKVLWEDAWAHASLGWEGYALVNPVFNRHGDLLVQLGVYGAKQTVYGTPRRRRSAITGKVSLRTMASASTITRGIEVPLPPSATSSYADSPRRTSMLLSAASNHDISLPRSPSVVGSSVKSISHSSSSMRMQQHQYESKEQMTITQTVQHQHQRAYVRQETAERYVYQSGF